MRAYGLGMERNRADDQCRIEPRDLFDGFKAPAISEGRASHEPERHPHTTASQRRDGVMLRERRGSKCRTAQVKNMRSPVCLRLSMARTQFKFFRGPRNAPLSVRRIIVL